jgi:two-component system, NarL family, sensor histidine kinase UhpB
MACADRLMAVGAVLSHFPTRPHDRDLTHVERLRPRGNRRVTFRLALCPIRYHNAGWRSFRASWHIAVTEQAPALTMTDPNPVSGSRSGARSLAPRAAYVDSTRRHLAIVFATLLLSVAAALGTWVLVQRQFEQSAATRFTWRCARITAILQLELNAYRQLLHGVSGLASVSPSLSVDQWRAYTRSAEAGAPPGLVLLGYAPVERASSDRTIVAPVRFSDTSGAADAVRGADLGSDPDRRDLLLRAARSGSAVVDAHLLPGISGAVSLTNMPVGASAAQAPGTTTVGLLMLYQPVYRAGWVPATPAERVAALSGFALATVDLDQLTRWVGADAMRDVRIRIRDATSGGATLLDTDSSGRRDLGDMPRDVGTRDDLTFGSSKLTIDYAATPVFLRGARASTPLFVLAVGLAGSGLLAWFAWWLWRVRHQASLETTDARLRSQRNEARLYGIIRSAMEAIITVDQSQRVIIFNPTAEKLFGCTAADALGASLDRFIPERFRTVHRAHVERFGVTGVTERQMGVQRRLYALHADGHEFPIEASISQVHDGDEKLYTVMLRDITERVRAEDDLRASREELQRLSAKVLELREEEKMRIARELHDDLGQQLTALKMEVSFAESELSGAGAVAAAPGLGNVYAQIDSIVASVRRIAADLRPVMLDDLGLVPAIEWLVHDFSARYKIRVLAHVDVGEIAFNRDAGTAVFRMIQEALTNVARHSGATEVMLDIVRDEPHCIVRIADNGRGMASDGRPGKNSFGLLGLRERAVRLGGDLHVQTAPGQGFALTVTLPLSAVEAGEEEIR